MSITAPQDTDVIIVPPDGGTVTWPPGGVSGEVLGYIGPGPNDVDWVSVGTPSGGDANFVYDGTGVPTISWTVTHNLGKYPSVMVVDTGNTVLEVNVHYVSVNQLTITFASPTSGKAYLN